MAAPAPPSKTLEKSQKIRCLQDNPKQKGTACRDRYEKYKSATTVKEFYEKEGTPADLDHDIGKGFIEVIQPTPAPSISPAPTTYAYEYEIVAHYPMINGSLADVRGGADGRGCDAQGGGKKLKRAAARDHGDAVLLNASRYVELPNSTTAAVSGDAPRTICLWVRIDVWEHKARLFEYGGDLARRFGLRTSTAPGRFESVGHGNATVNLTGGFRVAAARLGASLQRGLDRVVGVEAAPVQIERGVIDGRGPSRGAARLL